MLYDAELINNYRGFIVHVVINKVRERNE